MHTTCSAEQKERMASGAWGQGGWGGQRRWDASLEAVQADSGCGDRAPWPRGALLVLRSHKKTLAGRPSAAPVPAAAAPSPMACLGVEELQRACHRQQLAHADAHVLRGRDGRSKSMQMQHSGFVTAARGSRVDIAAGSCVDIAAAHAQQRDPGCGSARPEPAPLARPPGWPATTPTWAPGERHLPWGRCPVQEHCLGSGGRLCQRSWKPMKLPRADRGRNTPRDSAKDSQRAATSNPYDCPAHAASGQARLNGACSPPAGRGAPPHPASQSQPPPLPPCPAWPQCSPRLESGGGGMNAAAPAGPSCLLPHLATAHLAAHMHCAQHSSHAAHSE